jgi:hypothetical protein
MKIRKHGDLVDTKNGGNGYHGRCPYCGTPFVTDLGYCSWEGVECIEREVTSEYDIPDNVRSFAQFRGLFWNNKILKYIKSYSDEQFTIDQIQEIILSI